MTERNESEPIVELDHDHEDLEVLLNDLAALVQQVSVDATRERALKEARRLLSYFQKDMEAHFLREEDDLFPVLLEELPERRPAVEALLHAHGTFSSLVSTIEAALGSDELPSSELRDCLTVIARLTQSFQTHSENEMELVRALDAVVTDPRRRGLLRERLGGF